MTTCVDYTVSQCALSRTKAATCFNTVAHMFFFTVCSLCQFGALHCVQPATPLYSVFYLLIYHYIPNIYCLISARIALSSMRGIDSLVKSGECLLLQECFNEGVS